MVEGSYQGGSVVQWRDGPWLPPGGEERAPKGIFSLPLRMLPSKCHQETSRRYCSADQTSPYSFAALSRVSFWRISGDRCFIWRSIAAREFGHTLSGCG